MPGEVASLCYDLMGQKKLRHVNFITTLTKKQRNQSLRRVIDFATNVSMFVSTQFADLDAKYQDLVQFG